MIVLHCLYYRLTLVFLLYLWIPLPFALAANYQENYNSFIYIGDHEFQTEIANTLPKMQKGMMFRPHMKTNQAMIFVYPRVQRMQFWMKNTLIALDMLFFDAKGQLLEIKSNVPPCKTAACPTYDSRHHNILYVVELKAGTAEQLNIRVGDKLNGCGF